MEKEAHKRWFTLAKAEESFLRQRSRIQWLEEGDCNSAFFHRVIKSRQANNQILFLIDNDDTVIDSLESIKQHVVSFYQNLLGGPVASSTSSLDLISSLVSFRCSTTDSAFLSSPFSVVEIQQAFFSLPKNKAPGPDDYPAEFFTANWTAIGKDMIAAVEEFFSSGQILTQWNSTILTLIPKKPNASKITEFRPIACCNSVYKVISKLLANRLKRILPNIISNSQSAFIPGRSLVENVLMATELIQGYN